MIRKLRVASLIFCVLAVVFRFYPSVILASPAEINVPGDYAKIQWAIGNASVGDTIYVHSGTYHEYVEVFKWVKLIGDNPLDTIIAGSGGGPAVFINASEVVLRGFGIRNTLNATGVHILLCDSCSVTNNVITGCQTGIITDGSLYDLIASNRITDCTQGIFCFNTFNGQFENNTVTGTVETSLEMGWGADNTIVGNMLHNASICGLSLGGRDNTVYDNNITRCKTGILLDGYIHCENNTIYHNNLIDNAVQTDADSVQPYEVNSFDVGFPDGGNYWSNHDNTDVKSGPDQINPGSDGISDTEYEITTMYYSSRDYFPCAGPIHYFEVDYGGQREIPVICNTTIQVFSLNAADKVIRFKVTCDSGTGFCRLALPSDVVSGLWQNNYEVLVDGTSIDFGNWTTGSKTYIYFRYLQSTNLRTILLRAYPQPTIESADQTGTKKDSFDNAAAVYISGTGYTPLATYAVYIVNDTAWADGMSIPPRVSGTILSMTLDASGNVNPMPAWFAPLAQGKYDIIVDTNDNTKFDLGIDALDDNEVDGTAGFIVTEQEMRQLTISVFGSGSTDPASGVYTYTNGTEIPVQAFPNLGWRLDHWMLDGAFIEPMNPIPVTMGKDRVLMAIFVGSPPSVESCDRTGVIADRFSLTDDVYVAGNGYLPGIYYDVYVVGDVEWLDGMTIPAGVPGTVAAVLSDLDGNIMQTVVWNRPLAEGKYDICIDVDGDGQYDQRIDALDDSDIEVTAGFVIPEFSSFLILALFIIATLLAVKAYRRKWLAPDEGKFYTDS